MNLAEQAAALAARGFAVFPCRPGDKRPAIDRWEQRASTDAPYVLRAWPTPEHNIGIACGPSGLVVVDLDMPKEGKGMPPEWADRDGVNEGADVFFYLAEKAGVLGWPTTYMVMTPSKGTHFYYRVVEGREIRNSAGRIGPMVDVRAAGGYVVAAGSVTAAGTYAGCGDDVEPLPQWIAALADPPPPPRPEYKGVRSTQTPPRGRFIAVVDRLMGAQQGERNALLHWAACRGAEIVAEGDISRDAAAGTLRDAALHIGLTERETELTINSAFKGAR